MFNQIIFWPFVVVNWVHRKFTGKEDAGATLVEYALLLALIAVVAAGAIAILGHTVTNAVTNVNSGFSGVTSTT